MIIRRNLSILLCLLALCTTIPAADIFPGLEKLMTTEQMRLTGVSKLTHAERVALNNWLRNYLAGEKSSMRTAAAPATTSAAPASTSAARELADTPDHIVSQIDGEFKGWSDETLFRLKNGQVWKQRQKQRLHYNAVDPKVEIERNFFGFYVLHLVGTSYSIGVTRVK